jgi:hypothetical protein
MPPGPRDISRGEVGTPGRGAASFVRGGARPPPLAHHRRRTGRGCAPRALGARRLRRSSAGGHVNGQISHRHGRRGRKTPPCGPCSCACGTRKSILSASLSRLAVYMQYPRLPRSLDISTAGLAINLCRKRCFLKNSTHLLSTYTIASLFSDQRASRCISSLCESVYQWERPWCSYRTPFGYGVRAVLPHKNLSPSHICHIYSACHISYSALSAQLVTYTHTLFAIWQTKQLLL